MPRPVEPEMKKRQAKGSLSTCGSPDGLEAALKECRKAARRGYRIAKENLQETAKAIKDVSESLSRCLRSLEDGSVRTPGVVHQLKGQLTGVVNEPEQLQRTSRSSLEERRQRIDSFSVTLFGRTMAGKSTLMEILTRRIGPSQSIGMGAQRTTRDVRAYHWNGLEVTDVPGVAAFEGAEDEERAFKAAAQADLVLFLITDDALQPVKAECLARVRRLGKPVLGICSSGGRPSSVYGKHLLRQAHERKGPGAMGVILMTGYHQDCVDMATDLHEIGVDACISKPFPTAGRTLAVVIEEVMEKVRRRRVVAGSDGQPRQLQPFAGGVLAFHQRHIDLCGETIVGKNQKGYAWRILHLLNQKNERGRFIRMDSSTLAAKLDRDLMQNTLSQSIKALRERISEVMRDRLDLACGQVDVIDNRGQGYHLKDWIVVEAYDEAGVLVSGARPAAAGKADAGGNGDGAGSNALSERQRWVLAQLAGGGKLTRRQVEKQFEISDRTAKRELGELVEAGMIEYDRSESPGSYRLRA